MRKDVKIGLVLSLVAIVLAGWYFIGSGKNKSVPMDNSVASAGKDAPAPADTKSTPGAATNRARKPGVNNAERPPIAPRPPINRRPTTPVEPARPSVSDEIRPPLPPRTDRPESPILLSDVLPVDAAEPTPPAGPPTEGEHSDSIGAHKAVEDGVGPNAGPTKSETPEPSSAPPATDAAKPTVPDTRGPLPLVGRTPRPADERPAGNVRTYRIGQGDTLAILAELFYGKQEYAEFLVRANPGLDPRRLIVGQEIIIPETPGDLSVLNRAAQPEPAKTDKPAAPAPAAAERTYTVKAGDSFWKIADNELGDGNRWQEIYELNKAEVPAPNRLKVGQVLKLPQK